jgi:hypothetical protein
LIRPPARACLRTRYWSSSTGSGSGFSGAAPAAPLAVGAHQAAHGIMPPPSGERAGADVGLAERCWVVIPRDAGGHLTPGSAPFDLVTQNRPLGNSNGPGERVSWHPPIRRPRPRNARGATCPRAARKPGVAARMPWRAWGWPSPSCSPPRIIPPVDAQAPKEDDPQQRRPRLKLARAPPGTERGPAVACYSEPAGEPATTPPRRNASSGTADAVMPTVEWSTISAGVRTLTKSWADYTP